ncbi:heterokaryon incompatibility protein-domain-containing protein [Cadophora sp. MPI-SDFR-AT-0126]|nr:heterokaryon incompatibility protein-domain-containing protein [Leotiomycetes sp. MPI-SDFR-AT-0126]
MADDFEPELPVPPIASGPLEQQAHELPVKQARPGASGSKTSERFLEEVPIPPENAYKYQFIDHDNEIRILRVLHGKKDSALECILFQERLPDAGSKSHGLNSYRVLSYGWGQNEPTQRIKIFYDTGARGNVQDLTPFNISGVLYTGSNLAAALKQLRLEHEDVNLWVDTLCINQADVLERRRQARRKAQIYSQAQDVCVWLGEDKELKSKETFDFLDSIEDLQSWGNVADNPIGWNMVYKLLDSDLFGHILLVQDVALSKRAVLRWGSEEIAWSTFSNAIDLLVRKRAEIKERIWQEMGAVELETPFIHLVLNNWNRTRNKTIDLQDELWGHRALTSTDQKHHSSIESSDTDEDAAPFSYAPKGGKIVEFETLEDTDSEVSVASLESFAASTIASSATSLSEMLPVVRDGANEIANLISNDDELRKLLEKAFDLLEPERVVRNFRRALRSFSKELFDEAETVPQEQAAKFVGQKSRQIAVLVRQTVRRSDSLLLPSNDIDASRQKILQTYLAGLQPNSRPEAFPKTIGTGVGDEDSDEEEAENDVSDNHPNLARLRDWMLTASAMQALRDRFKLFLYPEKPFNPEERETATADTAAETSKKLPNSQTLAEDSKDESRQDQEFEEETSPSLGPEQRHSSLSVISPLLKPFYFFVTAWNHFNSKRPLVSGVVRLEWTCNCGHTSYDDFKEMRSGAVAAYAEKLINAGYATHAQSTNDAPGTATTLLTAARNQLVATRRSLPSFKPDKERKRVKKVRKFVNAQCSPEPRAMCRWLHLCLKPRPNAKVTKLEPLHVCKDDEQQHLTDATFFRRLRKAWKTQRTWTDLTLFKLSGIDFIQFSAFPDDAVDRIVRDKVPSTTEHYDFAPPPPLDMVPPIASEHMVHLLESACTPSMENTSFYLSQLPKKKDKPLKFVPTVPLDYDINTGYGLRFVEKPDAGFVARVLFLTAVIVGTVVGVCWSVLKKGDFEHAWVISAYCVSLVALAAVTLQISATS